MLGSFVDRVCGYRLNLRSVIHLGKRLLGLLKESKDSSSTEYALIFVIVHIQDLLEGQNIDTAMELLQSIQAIPSLDCWWSALQFPCSRRSNVVLPYPQLQDVCYPARSQSNVISKAGLRTAVPYNCRSIGWLVVKRVAPDSMTFRKY